MPEIAPRVRLIPRSLEGLRTVQAKVAGILALALVAFGSRVWHISAKSIWLDEATSWRSARMSLSHMIDYTGAADYHPPLYYGALHFWVKLLGDSEFGLRSLSATAGAATIVLLALTCWRMREPVLATALAILLLLNSTQLYFSQEARMYGLMGLFAASASVALGALIQKPTILRTAVYGLLLTCVVYTHYSGFVLVGVQAAVIAGYGGYAFWRERNPAVLIAGGLAFAAMAVAYIPWYSHLRQATRVGVSDVPDLTYDLLLATSKGAFGISRQGDVWLLPIAALLVVGIAGIARRWRSPMFAALATLALVPAGQLIVSMQSKPIFDLRQIAPYVPGLLFVLGVGIADIAQVIARTRLPYRLVSGALGAILAGVLLSFMYVGLADTYAGPSLEDWDTAAADLRDFNGPIYISASYAVTPFEYYYGVKPNVQSFGLWSPANQQVGQTAMIGISHQSEQSVLTALGTSVNIGPRRVYRGVIFYEVGVVHHAVLNVDVPLGQPNDSWSIDPQGYLRTNSDASSFTCKCQLDANGDGATDEPFAILIEYLDAGMGSFQVFGPSPSVVLASEPLTNTMQWRAAAVEVPAGTQITSTFALSRGVTFRKLQLMRSQLENADVFGSYQGGTRWILRPDGYIQSTDSFSYINASIPLDASNDGLIDRTAQVEIQYQRAGTGPLQIFGLRSGAAFAPELLQSTDESASGGWRTVSVELEEGTRLQPRVYVGRGVAVKAIRFTFADSPASP